MYFNDRRFFRTDNMKNIFITICAVNRQWNGVSYELR